MSNVTDWKALAEYLWSQAADVILGEGYSPEANMGGTFEELVARYTQAESAIHHEANLSVLCDMVNQHCQRTTENGMEFFSNFLSSDADAMRLLAAHGLMEIEDAGARVVWGKFTNRE